MATKTIEEKVAETILQKDIEVTVGGKKYKAAPASTATLILASEAVSRLPEINLDPEKVVEESLSVAPSFGRHCGDTDTRRKEPNGNSKNPADGRETPPVGACQVDGRSRSRTGNRPKGGTCQTDT